ncbi:DUF4856 domain-containing protein [Cytophaga aurantiaca]|uniref:DUF4856 domain-containing protein n=1 Tax=Cytophaga aurantiaca TaxID=29530 RepID=UPI0003745954|nr:DUF4856 domain-containing protein [Cytophaga aurantiaca]
MQKLTLKNGILIPLVVLIGLTTACKKKDDDAPAPTSTPGKRTTTINYSTLTPTTSYRTAFLDKDGDTTVNRNDGRSRLMMFRALITYIGTAASTNTAIDSTVMSNMFANKNSPFTGNYAYLNGLDMSIKEATAFSKSNQSAVHNYLEYAFGRMAYISNYTGQTASKGTPGKNGTYLVDANGIEWAQIIQKTLIGGYHLDYIGNVLLSKGLNADNQHLVTGKKYTQLEHNWDEAYGFFTVNDMYYNGTTDQAAAKVSNEYYLGSYAWEYNKSGFVKLHSAFLKGRAAIHNNDMTEVRAQAAIIRGILETAIGGAANGYMGKASDGTATEASRVHAFGEGNGFVYSTRFCTQTGADDAFSADLLDDLITPATVTFYDITAAQFTTVATKLRTKFALL